MTWRIGAWCAVSSKPQAGEDKDSLPYQEQQARDFARAVGGEVVRVYTVPGHTRDYWAWHEAERDIPAYAEVRADLEAGKLDVVHAVDADRLGRDPALIQQFYSLAERHSCEVYDASMPHQLGQQNLGHRYGTAVKSVAAGEDQRRRKRYHRLGMQKRIRRGLHSNSTWPLGYSPVYEGGVCTGAEFNEDIGAVQMMTDLFLAGTSYNEILEAMLGSAWALPGGQTWYQRRIWRTLHFDTYAGYVTWGPVRNEQPSDKFPALWDGETYRAILRERARRAQSSVKRTSSPFAGGVAVCARCGWNMHRTRSRHGAPYYLRCGKHNTTRLRRERWGPCHPNYIYEHKVAEALGRWLASFTSPADLAGALGDDTGLAALEAELGRAEARLEQIAEERLRLGRALGRGSLDFELHADLDQELLAERGTLESRARELGVKIRNRPEAASRLAWLEDLVGPGWERLDHLPDPELGAALRGAGVRVFVEEGEVKLIGFALD